MSREKQAFTFVRVFEVRSEGTKKLIAVGYETARKPHRLIAAFSEHGPMRIFQDDSCAFSSWLGERCVENGTIKIIENSVDTYEGDDPYATGKMYQKFVDDCRIILSTSIVTNDKPNGDQ